MKRIRTLFLMVSSMFCLFSTVIAQQFCPPVSPNEAHLPNWINLLYEPNPNIWEIDDLYNQWRRTQSAEKTTFSQYYKKWRRWVQPYIQPDGHLYYPDNATLTAEWNDLYDDAPDEYIDRSGSSWVNLGPFETWNDAVNGNQIPVSWQANVYCLDQSISNPDILYCGTEGGEVFRTENRGLHWTPASLSLASGAIDAIAIHPLNPNIIYAGDHNRIYRTVDAGISWEVLLTESQMSANCIEIHPQNPNIIFVSGNKGMWRSVDGGFQWSPIFTDACYAVMLKPDNADVVYVLKNDPADKRCIFMKSTDGGQSFEKKSNGWFNGMDPARQNAGARMSVTPADPNRIYVVLIGQAKEGDNGFIGVYRSDDAGESWTLPNPPAGGPYSSAHPNLAVINPASGTGFHQGFYNLGIAASHENADHLLVGHLSLWSSSNGGASFQQRGGYGGDLAWIHPDVQDIHVLGKDTWVCTDGGINYSTNFFSTHESRKNGITGSDYWGFGQGWNDDILVGGRYHNGNSGWYESYPEGLHLRLGGAESPTGYVSPGPERRTWFSDIGGKILPLSIEQPSIHFSVSAWPNEGYYPGESSDQVWGPDCYNHYYMGSGTGLWKTEDGGAGFDLIKSFDQPGAGIITQIAYHRTHPHIMYVAQRNQATWSEGWIWKTNDSGLSWEALSLPTGYKRRLLLTCSALDDKTVWVGYPDGANLEKLFRSDDGGLTWTNLSATLFNGESPQTIVHIGGTNNSILLGTNKSVYYYNGNQATWEKFNTGLPTQISSNILRPFYRDAKIRMGAYGKGIWERPLPEPFEPVIQPTVDKKTTYCIRDSFQFDDHSILDHSGVSWTWSFPTGQPSSSQLRNPKVQFNAPGEHTAVMTITGPFGKRSAELTVKVINECDRDSVAGMALILSEDGDAATIEEIKDSLYAALTFSAWVWPDGIQSDYAGILIGAYNDNAFGLNVRENNQLGYHWPGGAWWWNSGLYLESQKWQHVAIVVQPGSVTIYHNGIPKVHNTNTLPVELSALNIGRYRNWNSRTWKGKIDEVAIWGKALTTDEIRIHMHLTKNGNEYPDLLSYYQFNRTSGQETDRVGTRHLKFNGGAHRVPSSAPVGAGISDLMVIPSNGTYDMPNTKLQVTFDEKSSHPGGPIVFSRIIVSPDTRPDKMYPIEENWWVVNQYGTNQIESPASLVFNKIEGLQTENEQNPNTISLFHRDWNAEGDSWLYLGAPESVTTASEGALIFGSETYFGQWILYNNLDPVSSIDKSWPESSFDRPVICFPNPAKSGMDVQIKTQWEGTMYYRILDARGVSVASGIMSGTIPLRSGIHPGTYFVEVKCDRKMARTVLVVQD